MSDLTVTSSSFGRNAVIPVDFTCDGNDTLPSIIWSTPPEATRSLVVFVDDPDVPGSTFTHFVVFNVPFGLRQFKPGSDPGQGGARVGSNDYNNVRYNGPCPPKGEEHQYRFIVFALDAMLSLPDGATREQVESAMSGHLLAEGALSARFGH